MKTNKQTNKQTYTQHRQTNKQTNKEDGKHSGETFETRKKKLTAKLIKWNAHKQIPFHKIYESFLGLKKHKNKQ